MGKIWLDANQIGTFEPQTEGSAGSIWLDTNIIGNFALALSGDVFIDGVDIGDYWAHATLPPPPPPPPSEGATEDPRYRTRVYLNAYLNHSAFTKDDAAPAIFAVIYANPDYALIREFLAPLSPVDVLFCVSKPDSTAIIGQDRKAYAYEEHVPITVWTIDKTGITGTKLCWKAEAELRRIIETYPLGSLRSLTRIEDNEQNLGSTILYSVEYMLKYTRAKA